MTKHTEEKLYAASGGYLRTDTTNDIIVDLSHTEPADALHIIACWNACEGINPEAVPEMLEALEAMNAACNMADVRERDRLTAAAIPAARAALAKARETH